MKKVLFATTALIMTAGVASAEVALSGTGRMGVVYDGNDWAFTSRMRVKFTLSGETDGGMTFGGSFRADNASAANHGAAGSIFASGTFGKIELGDTVSAAEAAIGDLPEVGLTDIGSNDTYFLTGDTTNLSTTSTDNPSLLYSYTMDALSFYLSLSDGYDYATGLQDTQETSVAVSYATDVFSVGLGYEVADLTAGANPSQVIVGGTYKFGDTTIAANYGDFNNAALEKQYGLGVTSVFGATSVLAFYRVEDAGATDTAYYGVGASYDLGGGASVVGGIADSDATGSDTVADLGVSFTF